MLSALLHTNTTGFFDFFSIKAISWSAAVTPCFTSVKNIITSAISIAILACSLICDIIISSDSGSIPAVSTTVKFLPLQFVSAYTLSLVTPGVSSTIEILLPTM